LKTLQDEQNVQKPTPSKKISSSSINLIKTDASEEDKKKLIIPNVSKEWLLKLRSKLKNN
jgi:hypothetical protein